MLLLVVLRSTPFVGLLKVLQEKLLAVCEIDPRRENLGTPLNTCAKDGYKEWKVEKAATMQYHVV